MITRVAPPSAETTGQTLGWGRIAGFLWVFLWLLDSHRFLAFKSLTLGPKKSDSRVLTQVWDSLYICWCWFSTRQDVESPRAYTFGHVCEGVSRSGEIEVGRPTLLVSGIAPYPGVLDRKKQKEGSTALVSPCFLTALCAQLSQNSCHCGFSTSVDYALKLWENQAFILTLFQWGILLRL